MDRINRRTIYTESKINLDKNVREIARKQYEELAEIPEDFQYQKFILNVMVHVRGTYMCIIEKSILKQ